MKRTVMMTAVSACFAAALSLMPGDVFASVSEDVSRGLDALRSGRFEEAEAALRRAQFEAPEDPRIAYDLGITAYLERRFETAAQQFETVASSPAANAGLAADALHNLGNARFSAGEYRRAVEAYQASLVRREDQATQYNLEQALKLLAEQEKAAGNDQNSGKGGSSQDQGGKAGDSKQDGNKSGEKSDKKEEQSGQSGSEKQNQGQSGSEKKEGQGGRQDQEQKNNAGNASDTQDSRSENQANMASDTSRQADQQQNQPQNANASDASKMAEQTPASGSTSWNEQDAKLRDVQLDPKTQSAKDIPDASERARAMKNTKLNGYMVEKILRQMEDRERDLQRRYRRDPSQRDEMMDPFDDPFFMDPDRMREFMEGRQGGRRQKPEGDTPDW